MTGLILNGKAVCCMHMGNFEEAETLLLEALNKASYIAPEDLLSILLSRWKTYVYLLNR